MLRVSIVLATLTIMSVALFGWYASQEVVLPVVHHPHRVVNQSVDGSYQSVACLQTASITATGVLLKSGYMLTASHCVDRNHNGIIDPHEKLIKAEFFNSDGTSFITTATTIATSHAEGFEDLDIAVLALDRQPLTQGVDLLTNEEYQAITLGTENITMGMTNGEKPANITRGYISSKKNKYNHRSSATVYLGNSGGGVFLMDKRLVGIISKVGTDRAWITIPIISNHRMVGQIQVSYTRILAGTSQYVPAPEIRKFVEQKGLTKKVFPELKLLQPQPKPKPSPRYFHFLWFNLFNLINLLMVFRATYWLERRL